MARVYHIKLDDSDRRAIGAYQKACHAGWREESCRFVASLFVSDEQRLNRILYQAKVSDPLAFRAGGVPLAAPVRSVASQPRARRQIFEQGEQGQ